MLRRLLILGTVLIAISVAVFSVWRIQDTTAKERLIENQTLKALSSDEIDLVLASQVDSAADIKVSSETRQAFLKGMREYLGLAAAARQEGLTDDRNFQINFAHKTNLLLADLYQAKISKDKGAPFIVSRESLDAVWTDNSNVKQFDVDMSAMQEIQNSVARERGENYTVSKLQGGSLLKAKDSWARAKIVSDMARADTEFMSQPVVGLRTKILEAGILSADYLRKYWAGSIKATDRDLAAFVKDHPQYDPKLKRAKAEGILQKIKAGGDFQQLAKEHSEDRTTRDSGGLYENVSQGSLWEEVERAAISMAPSEVANQLIETDTGFHILKLESKKVSRDASGKETTIFSIRHILLQKKFEDPDNRNPLIPSPFLTAEEIAKASVEKEKRNRFVEQTLAKQNISLPEDFVPGS